MRNLCELYFQEMPRCRWIPFALLIPTAALLRRWNLEYNYRLKSDTKPHRLGGIYLAGRNHIENDGSTGLNPTSSADEDPYGFLYGNEFNTAIKRAAMAPKKVQIECLSSCTQNDATKIYSLKHLARWCNV